MQDHKEQEMETELARCECCGFKEDCTQDYISQVKSEFLGKWLCGLCSEAVKDEVNKYKYKSSSNALGLEDAIKAHMSFCTKYKSNPAILVAEGMSQMLRKRSVMFSSSSSLISSSKKYSRSSSTSSQDQSFLCCNKLV